MDLVRGTVLIDGIEIGPGYTFSDFCRSPFFNGQDGERIIYLDGIKTIEDNHYIISLFFMGEKLYMLSLICCDRDFSPTTEEERKGLHDEILSKYAVNKQNEYWWGKVVSEYNRISNLSSIDLIYY